MAVGKFTEANRTALIERIAAGASLADAARGVGVHPSTVKGWITRGRREPESSYGEFADAIEAARVEHAEQAPPMTYAEFRRRLDAAVRAGSVQAMKLWLVAHDAGEFESQPDSELGFRTAAQIHKDEAEYDPELGF